MTVRLNCLRISQDRRGAELSAAAMSGSDEMTHAGLTIAAMGTATHAPIGICGTVHGYRSLNPNPSIQTP